MKINDEYFLELVQKIQKEVSTQAFEIMSKDTDNSKGKLLSFISKYLDKNKVDVDSDITNIHLAKLIYDELSEYSVLTDLLSSSELEEVNINAWNDIQIKYRDGRIDKAPHFLSPTHAVDIVKRLLAQNNVILDGMKLIAESDLVYKHNKIRITAIMHSIVDADVGVSASMRILYKKTMKREDYISSNFITDDGLEFLESCIKYGVSTIFAGQMGSGKTTFQNFILSTLPNDYRIYTIETGARELDLVKHDEDGNILNNVIHARTRLHENDEFNYDQDSLIIAGLRLNCPVMVVAEMRDKEAQAGQDASETDNTIITTLHAGTPALAYKRIAGLRQKKNEKNDISSLMQALLKPFLSLS